MDNNLTLALVLYGARPDRHIGFIVNYILAQGTGWAATQWYKGNLDPLPARSKRALHSRAFFPLRVANAPFPEAFLKRRGG